VRSVRLLALEANVAELQGNQADRHVTRASPRAVGDPLTSTWWLPTRMVNQTSATNWCFVGPTAAFSIPTTYGHFIPRANISFVDRLDALPAAPEAKPESTDVKRVASPAQPRRNQRGGVFSHVVDLIGGGGRARTYDLRIMSSSKVRWSQLFWWLR
jgi:hypothetical protein